MPSAAPDPLTITDARGVERPLWNFPRSLPRPAETGRITAREQREIETRLGVFWSERTPLQISWVWWLALIPVALVATVRAWVVSGPVMGFGFVMLWTLAPLCGWLSRIPRTPALLGGAFLFYVGILSVLVAAWWSGPPEERDAPTELAYPAAILAVATAGGFAANLRRLKRDPRRSPPRVRRAMLAAHRCPSCAMKLVPDPESPASLLRCPQCDAAWEIMNAPRPRNPSHCVGCGYPLAGLPADARHRARCPECGLANVMPRGPLAPEPPAAAPQPPPTCWNCNRSLRGLPLVNGDRVECPGCGQWRSGLTEADVRIDRPVAEFPPPQ